MGLPSIAYEKTICLDKQKGGKFLFLRWRPNYGCPTFLHYNLSEKHAFGEQTCRATFWVQTTTSPATIHFYSNGVFSDPVIVDGPTGLVGVVLWPGLTHDIWGTKLVENDDYTKALKWTLDQVKATQDCLANNLEKVIERVQDSNLLKKSYVDETLARMKTLWA